MAGEKYWKISCVVIVIMSENIGLIMSGCMECRISRNLYKLKSLCWKVCLENLSATGPLQERGDTSKLYAVMEITLPWKPV